MSVQVLVVLKLKNYTLVTTRIWFILSADFSVLSVIVIVIASVLFLLLFDILCHVTKNKGVVNRLIRHRNKRRKYGKCKFVSHWRVLFPEAYNGWKSLADLGRDPRRERKPQLLAPFSPFIRPLYSALPRLLRHHVKRSSESASQIFAFWVEACL